MEQPNLTYIKELSGDDAAFEAKFIGIIKQEFPGEKQTYVDSLDRRDYKAVAEVVHKIKHKFNILGLSKGYHLAVDHEEKLLQGNASRHPEFMEVLNSITAYLKTL